MIGVDMSNVEPAGTYPRPKAGGYVIVITKATNNVNKERTEFEFDFAEGEFKDHYTELYEKLHFWGGKFNKSYTDKALSFYRAFTEAVVASNEDTTGLVIGDYNDVDETKFVGKLIGMVVGEKEYIGNDGKKKVKIDTYNANFMPVSDIREGKYEVPEFVPLEEGPAPSGGVVDTTVPEGFTEVNVDDTPF